MHQIHLRVNKSGETLNNECAAYCEGDSPHRYHRWVSAVTNDTHKIYYCLYCGTHQPAGYAYKPIRETEWQK
jgi:hypothetical protein